MTGSLPLHVIGNGCYRLRSVISRYGRTRRLLWQRFAEGKNCLCFAERFSTEPLGEYLPPGLRRKTEIVHSEPTLQAKEQIRTAKLTQIGKSLSFFKVAGCG